MNTWRGFVVLLAAALGGFIGMALWVGLLFEGTREPHLSPWSALEGTTMMLTGVFLSGRATARVLLGEETAQQILLAGRWRLVLLTFLTGALMIAAQFLDGPPRRPGTLSWVTIGTGAALVLWAATQTWAYCLSPWVRERREAA